MNVKKVAGIIAVTLLLTGVVSYAVYSMLTFHSVENNVKCHDLIVTIDKEVSLMNEDEVHVLLREQELHPIGKSLPDLRTEQIERFLRKHPYVKTVRCYHDPTGQVFLNLTLRTPLFVVMGNENYYVDKEGKYLPVKPGVTAYVPVLTGRVTKSMLKDELYDMVSYIGNHEFWNAQIQQIHVREDSKIELVPHVGDALILLGTTENYELKLDRLLRLYQQAFNVMGWNTYRQLDLRFENQIVATRNKEARK
ncbi:MAG: cell division protein FtsQ/DivIB [Paludibacter sp.]|jgi:cell division protein FtsQ|nr:cell division protein FtsQ/DivIB [Paludibacter sp.]